MDAAMHDDGAGSIAIVGLAGRFPAARNASELWQLLAQGREATQWLGDEELRAAGVSERELADPDYVRASLVLPGMEMFDADFFGFSKRDAAVLDPQHRHFLECAWEALEDAGHPPESFEGAVGVFGGCGMQSYFAWNLLRNPQLVQSMGLFLLRHTGNDKDFLTSRVSYLLDLKGPSVSVQTACSTSLVAVHMAAQSLLAGECDMALAGGSSIELPHRRGYRYAQGEILSRDGHCKAFDDSADGTVFGSGTGIVVLRRLADALRDGDNIHAVIRGSAINNDGSGKAGYLAPSVDGQAAAAAEALAVAGVDPRSVSYIEAHGTGTPVGDPIEVAALTQAYGGGAAGSCGIGSLKTNIGHLDTAAGVASLIKVCLALRHGLIPATLNFSRANSRFDLDKTPFYVADQQRPWPRGAAPRRAGINSLGVGGTNAHVIVEEAPAAAASTPALAPEPQVFTLSARTPAALDALKDKWLSFLAQPPEGFSLRDAAHTTQVGRRAFAQRCAVVAGDVLGLRSALQAKAGPRSFSRKAAEAAPGVVFMFSGGGANYPGVGRELLGQRAFREAVDECFRLMPADAPPGLRALMFDTTVDDAQAAQTLQQPAHAIPAIFVLELAIARLWQSWGVQPAAVIGHSVGEYAAACVAGVISLQDALAMVVLRGQLFELAPAGGMLSVDLAEQDLRQRIGELPLDIACVNAPDSCIASGSIDAIAQLEKRLAEDGTEARRLRIQVAAHSRLLDGILDRFRARVAGLRLSAPAIPLISNLSGDWADAQTFADPEYWVRHLRQPVRFAAGLGAALQRLPDAVLLEAGPGQGLCALARLNSSGQPRVVLASTAQAQERASDLEVALASLGAFWACGGSPQWAALRQGAAPRRVSLPTYAFEHQRHWIDAAPEAAEAAPAAAQEPGGIRRLEALDDWFRVPQWKPSPLSAAMPGAAQHWLVFGDHGPLTAEVARQIAAQGAQLTLVRRGALFAREADGGFAVAPGNAEHLNGLLGGLEQAVTLPGRVLYLWPLETQAGRAQAALSGQPLAFDGLLALAKAVQDLDWQHPMQLCVATAGAVAVEGEAVEHPERMLALGPVRVIPRELPQIATRLVDLGAQLPQDLQATAALLLSEAASPSGPDLVAWRGGKRWAQQLVRQAEPEAEATATQRIRQGGSYLITGGLGDIALDLAEYLAAHFKAKITLVSRRALPPRAQWHGLAGASGGGWQARVLRRLAGIEAAGGELLPLAADASDRDAMAKALAACQVRFGALHGVFHAAGVLDDGPITSRAPEAVQRVLQPKAQAAQVLHELLPPGSLDLFALFSSTSVYLGSPGQIDYVAANAFLDALAASRPDGLAIHWGIWGDKGMAARAYGRHGGEPEPGRQLHPLLGRRVLGEAGAVFQASYAPKDLWVLHEHAVAGQPVLPGTAYIEIARAAMTHLHPGCAVEIRSLSFEEAMVFDGPAPRSVRIALSPAAEGYDFSVRSRDPGDERWVEHARAGVRQYEGRLPAGSAVPEGGWEPGRVPQGGPLVFGARWHNITRMHLDGRQASAELALARRFEHDAVDYACHPALLDMAATFGLHLLGDEVLGKSLFVPMSVQRIVLGAAPLGTQLVSHVEHKGHAQERFAAFDVRLQSPTGQVLALFEGFSLRGIDPGAMGHPPRAGQRKPVPLAQALLACGIRGEDAPALFARVLAAPQREIVVSSIALHEIARAMQPVRTAPAAKKEAPAAAATVTAGAGVGLNRVETAIAEVWRDLLGADEVGKDDDFFALGGHSLAAVRLFARIRKHFGADLPLATLFQAPTLAALSALVAEAAGITDTASPAAAEPAVAAPGAPRSNVISLLKRSWSPLIEICKGRPERKPVFCVHGAGGNVLNFKPISDGLGADRPFYGLQAQGVDGRMPPLSSVEAMAAQYVEAIRTVAPEGPYRLAGYSAGGVIALEMAQQLRKAGHEVALLAMIDTLSPTAAGRKVPIWRKFWLMRRWSLPFLLDWPGRRRRGKAQQVSYLAALEKIARGEPLPPELADFHLFRNFVDAQERYRPQPYEGDMVLFKATLAEMAYLNAGLKLGWEEHVRGEVRVTEINGSHFSLMSEPGVSQLVEGLRRALAAVDESGDGRAPQGVGGVRPVVGVGRGALSPG